MVIDLIGISPDPSIPSQFLELNLGTQFPLPETCEVVIERPGQEEPYLAPGGWQANYTQIRVQLRKIGRRRDDLPLYGLSLSREILRFFEAGYNYKISLFELQGGELGFFVIGWDHVSEPLPNPEPSPVPEPMPQPVPQPVPEPEPSPMPDPEPFPDPEPPPDPGPEPLPGPSPASMPNHQPKPIGASVVLRCPKCDGEIFSTFSTCPYCGSSISDVRHN